MRSKVTETIRIPNRITRLPVALSDVMIAAPVASRLLFRSSIPGGLVGAAAAGAYMGSAARDWLSRRGVRTLDFRRSFGVDVLAPPPMSRRAREEEISRLLSELSSAYRPHRTSRSERARRADRALTELIASHTGQRVLTSTSVRSFMLPKLLLPFAVGACDRLSGEVGIFRDLGIFEPHVIAHEFAHRKGYVFEVEAQLLAYLALTSPSSRWLEGRISALAERLYRQIAVLSHRSPPDCRALVKSLGLRPELESAFLDRCGQGGGVARAARTMERLYELRMRLTGQNGLSDYDEGFTNVLHAIESSGGSKEG